jgi:hypothetical protein
MNLPPTVPSNRVNAGQTMTARPQDTLEIGSKATVIMTIGSWGSDNQIEVSFSLPLD